MKEQLIKQIKQLVTSFGWKDIGKVLNPYMISFLHEETKARMNVYYTTMTVTIQYRDKPPKTMRNIDLITLENLLS